jgi:hypothetical protein
LIGKRRASITDIDAAMGRSLTVSLVTMPTGVLARVACAETQMDDQLITARDVPSALAMVTRVYGDLPAVISFVGSKRVLMTSMTNAMRIVTGRSALSAEATEPPRDEPRSERDEARDEIAAPPSAGHR